MDIMYKYCQDFFVISANCILFACDDIVSMTEAVVVISAKRVPDKYSRKDSEHYIKHISHIITPSPRTG